MPSTSFSNHLILSLFWVSEWKGRDLGWKLYFKMSPYCLFQMGKLHFFKKKMSLFIFLLALVWFGWISSQFYKLIVLFLHTKFSHIQFYFSPSFPVQREMG